ncbi:MAG: MFS transporter, partial [Nitrososphaerales archaeon]
MARPILSASTVVFFAYTGQFMAYPIIPFYVIRELNGTPLDIGLILFSNLILAAIFSVPMGVLSDKWGRKQVIFMGAAIATVGYALLPFTQSIFQLLIVFALAGLGHSAYGPGTVAYTGDVVTTKDAARGFGWTQISRNMSISIGPAIGGFLGAFFGLAIAFFVCAVFLLVGSIVTLVLIPTRVPVKQETQGSGQETGSSLSGLIKVLKDFAIITLLMATFGYSFAILAYRGFIPLFAEGMNGTPIFDLALPAYVGVLFSVQAAASILARIPLAKYSDKTGRRAPFVISGLLLTALTV